MLRFFHRHLVKKVHKTYSYTPRNNIETRGIMNKLFTDPVFPTSRSIENKEENVCLSAPIFKKGTAGSSACAGNNEKITKFRRSHTQRCICLPMSPLIFDIVLQVILPTEESADIKGKQKSNRLHRRRAF